MKKTMHLTFFNCLILGVLAGMIAKLFILDIVHITGTSMEPTLHNGSSILINKLAYGIAKPFGSSVFFLWNTPKKGDVVVYMHEDKMVIKRCIATSKCLLEFSTNNGYTLTVNNIDYPLTEEQFHQISSSGSVPQNTILAIGDNYKESIDSRNYGFIPVNNILGKALCK